MVNGAWSTQKVVLIVRIGTRGRDDLVRSLQGFVVAALAVFRGLWSPRAWYARYAFGKPRKQGRAKHRLSPIGCRMAPARCRSNKCSKGSLLAIQEDLQCGA